MRLLNTTSLKFREFREDCTPPYITASHRWLSEDEATYQDVRDGCKTTGAGYKKMEAFAKYIRENLPAIEWLWIDTCCINKDSAAELSEAINSMFAWYSGAALCLAYLADVQTGDVMRHLEKSEWFQRGWTLQELLAPRTVLFVTNEWQVIGYKGGSLPSNSNTFSGACLDDTISGITGIPEQVLHDYQAGQALSVCTKLNWMEGRKTTKPEDMSYALFGILGVTLPAIYGEKFEGARQRLLAAIHQREIAAGEQAKYLRKLGNWVSPMDPWIFHESARQRHEPQTGAWLLQHYQYLAWKSGRCRSLWVYGKAGCGKTILCSTAIEDTRTHCQHTPNIGHAIFYFSFSDTYKQTFENLVKSLVAQLGWREPGLSLLKQAYERVQQSQPGLDELQKILLSSVSSLDRVYLHLDALDECPESDQIRQNVLDGIADIFKQAPNIYLLMTSRDIPDIRHVVQELGAEELPIAAGTVDIDIQKYVSTQLSRLRKLSRLDSALKTLIEETLTRRADGMFRWAYCQLVELTKSKDTRPKSIKAALLSLPKDLDETYERILNTISEDDHTFAMTLIRWIAYAKYSLTLAELAEASAIEWSDDVPERDLVNEDNRVNWEDILELLAGFVIIEGADEHELRDPEGRSMPPDKSVMEAHRQQFGKNTKIRLAHFSVREYLESSRILHSKAKSFHLDPTREHTFITQSCLVYLLHYSNSSRKTRTKGDLDAFPLLRYAAAEWRHHASLQRHESLARELSLLDSYDRLCDWILVCGPNLWGGEPFKKSMGEIEMLFGGIGTGLYYASLLGLGTVVRAFLNAGADIEGQGGYYGTALVAASHAGHRRIVRILLEAEAWVDAQGKHGTALQAASETSRTDVMQMLIRAGANVNMRRGRDESAIQHAANTGNDLAVQMLLEAKADLGLEPGSYYGSALHGASQRGHESIVRMLIHAGADIHAHKDDPHWWEEIPSAYSRASEKMRQVMLDAEAEVNRRREILAFREWSERFEITGRRAIEHT